MKVAPKTYSTGQKLCARVLLAIQNHANASGIPNHFDGRWGVVWGQVFYRGFFSVGAKTEIASTFSAQPEVNVARA